MKQNSGAHEYTVASVRHSEDAVRANRAAGLALASLRINARKTSQTWLGDQIGFSQDSLSKFENGERAVSFSVLITAALALGLTPENALMAFLEHYNSLKTVCPDSAAS